MVPWSWPAVHLQHRVYMRTATDAAAAELDNLFEAGDEAALRRIAERDRWLPSYVEGVARALAGVIDDRALADAAVGELLETLGR